MAAQLGLPYSAAHQPAQPSVLEITLVSRYNVWAEKERVSGEMQAGSELAGGWLRF